jgi:hypothetical protein
MTANEIKIVLMNVAIPSNSTRELAHWKIELQKYVDKLLTPSRNPPNYIIFYQEGCKDRKIRRHTIRGKVSFLRKKMGNYTFTLTEEGIRKTNGIIYHRSFNLIPPREALNMDCRR